MFSQRRTLPSTLKVNRMSIEKDEKTQLTTSTNQKQRTQLDIVRYSGGIVRYHILARDPLSIDPLDIDILCRQTLLTPTVLPNLRKKILVFRQSEYIICNWSGDSFPSVFYINSPQFVDKGYVSRTGLPSSRIAALELTQVNPTLQSDMRSYDLRYVLKESSTWNLDLLGQKLQLKFSTDEQTTSIKLPILNPLTLNFEIRYEMS